MGTRPSALTEEQLAELERQLRHVELMTRQAGRKILTNYPITPPQFEALQWLKDEGDMTIGELSGKMHLAFSTTTDLVDRMESSGLVERVRDKNDRRVVRIHLLDKGRALIRNVIHSRRMDIASKLSHLSLEQVEYLLNALKLLNAAMKREQSER